MLLSGQKLSSFLRDLAAEPPPGLSSVMCSRLGGLLIALLFLDQSARCSGGLGFGGSGGQMGWVTERRAGTASWWRGPGSRTPSALRKQSNLLFRP